MKAIHVHTPRKTYYYQNDTVETFNLAYEQLKLDFTDDGGTNKVHPDCWEEYSIRRVTFTDELETKKSRGKIREENIFTLEDAVTSEENDHECDCEYCNHDCSDNLRWDSDWFWPNIDILNELLFKLSV